MMISQASAFNESCNIYAPHYRQATYFSYFDKNEDGYMAHDLAYQDVEDAFDYYLENFNNGKPFIIAAHSQGSLHGQRLIHNKIQNSYLKDQMICAYLVGYIIPEDHFEILFPNLELSKTPTDTGTIITWASVIEGHVRGRDKTIHWLPSGWTKQDMGQKIISTNPISWTLDDQWHNSLNKNLAITIKANNYNFADRLATKYSGSIKSIIPSSIQNFDCRINSDNGFFGIVQPDAEDDLFTFNVASSLLNEPVEQLTIDFVTDSLGSAIRLRWDLTQVLMPFK